MGVDRTSSILCRIVKYTSGKVAWNQHWPRQFEEETWKAIKGIANSLSSQPTVRIAGGARSIL